jgi:hypothetical protein
MADKPEPKEPGSNPDERVSIPLPFEDALRAILQVDPDKVPTEPESGDGKIEKRPPRPPK